MADLSDESGKRKKKEKKTGKESGTHLKKKKNLKIEF